MVRSSVAAFYPLARGYFYLHGFLHCDGFTLHFLWLHIGSEVKQIVHRMPEILFAAEIPFRCLDRCMAEQELNLLQFAAARVAQLRTGPPQVVRCDMLHPGSLAA